MSIASTIRPRLPAIAAACLLSVALPAVPALAKEKNKAPKPAMEVDYSVSVPSIEADGSNVSDEVLTDILGGNIVAHAEELANLDASSIAVPEIKVVVTSKRGEEAHEATLVFTDLALDGVADGIAKTVSVGGVSLVADDVDVTFGEMSAENLSISGIMSLYGAVPAASTDFSTIYSSFSASGGTLKSDEANCEIGAVSSGEFKARPLKTSIGEMMALTTALERAGDNIDPALTGQVMRMYADILTAFETSETTSDGISCDGTDTDGNPMQFSIAGMTMGGMSPGSYPSISMTGMDFAIEGDGKVSLGNFTFKPMDLTSTIATLESAPEAVDDAWVEANARALMPSMEGFSFSDFAMDVPDPESSGSRIKAQIAKFDLTLARYLNGIPTDMDMSASNIKADIPEDSTDESLTQLRALGITSIDAGFRIAAAWNQDADAIDLKEVSVTGADLATVLLAGKITNATESLFALDPDTAMAAGMALALKSLNLTVTDQGLSDIVLKVAAADQGGDPEAMRPVFAGLAQGTVISLMAGAADAAKLGEAVNNFVAGKAKTLHIGIEAKDDPGLGLNEFMAAESDPTTLLPLVNVSAEAK